MLFGLVELAFVYHLFLKLFRLFDIANVFFCLVDLAVASLFVVMLYYVGWFPYLFSLVY